MDIFSIVGQIPLHGDVQISGAKNVAIKAFVASLLTDEPIIIHNIPNIRDVIFMLEVVQSLGLEVQRENNTVRLQNTGSLRSTVPLEVGARLRTSSMVVGPLLARLGEAKIPNPGGCRIGARPIDRHIEGLRGMGTDISYNSDDGYFHAKAKKLHGVHFSFSKNSHTGTETLLLAAVLAEGETIIENAAEEIEVDDLIHILVSMGANIQRITPRTIRIVGVTKLHGTTYTIMPDRNEEVTFALAAAVTKGRITVHDSRPKAIKEFLDVFERAGGMIKYIDDSTTEYSAGPAIRATDITTRPHPGFMTDWQAPWAVFMTQAQGVSTIHETIFESRFSYVSELKKMGARIEFYDPEVQNPKDFYNFNISDKPEGYHQGVRITGPTPLHNAVLVIDDLRAGATLVLAALAASGESTIHGVEQIDRGYEHIEDRLALLGANIRRIKEDSL